MQTQLTPVIVPQFSYVTWYSWTRDELQGLIELFDWLYVNLIECNLIPTGISITTTILSNLNRPTPACCSWATNVKKCVMTSVSRRIGINNHWKENPCLMRIHFTQISLTRLFKSYYETEIPSLMRICLDFVWTDTT